MKQYKLQHLNSNFLEVWPADLNKIEFLYAFSMKTLIEIVHNKTVTI